MDRPPRPLRLELVKPRYFPVVSGFLTQDSVHPGVADRAFSFGRTSAVGHFDFFSLELPLFAALHAITLIRRHGSSSDWDGDNRVNGRTECIWGGVKKGGWGWLVLALS